MKETMIVWRRLGKEHGEDQGKKVNAQDVVESHIQTKMKQLQQTPEKDWCWWQIND